MRERKKAVRRMPSKDRAAGVLSTGFCLLVLLAIAFIILMPFLDKLSVVFQGYEDLMDATVKYIPKNPTLGTLKETVTATNYWSALLNTTVLSLLSAVLQMFSCAFIAYGFANFKFPGKRLLFIVTLAILIIPPQLLMSPYYTKFRYFDILGIIQGVTGHSLNLVNSYWPFIILSVTGLGLKNSLYIYLFRQYYCNLPRQLEEAGYVDGAGTLRIFFRIILPNAKALMITVFLFAFTWQWSDSTYTNILVPTRPVLSTILGHISLYKIETIEPVVRSAMVNTAILLIILPLVLLYAFTQRYFIEGVERSGIVG